MRAPRIPSFFKTRAPRGYQPKTIYYDERKERLKELYGDSPVAETSEERLRSRWESARNRRPEKSYNPSAVIVGLLIVLGLLAYLLIY